MGSLQTSSNDEKPHAICIPYPAQGHITPMLKLAKILHSKGFHITFVNTEYNRNRFLRSFGPNALDGLPSFRFEAIPDGLPQTEGDTTQAIPSVCESTERLGLGPFKELVARLNADPSVPRVSCIVADVVLFFMLNAGEELGVPEVLLWTASVCGLLGYAQYEKLVDKKIVPFKGSPGPVTCIISDSVMPFTLDASREIGNVPLIWLWTASVCGFLGYSQYRPLFDKGIVPFQDSAFLTNGSLEETVDWIPESLKDMQLKYIPSFIRTTDKDDIMFNFLLHCVETTAKSSAPVIFNSFDSFEKDVLLDVAKLVSGPIYTVGPLDIMAETTLEDPATKSLGSNLWKEDSKCLRWLDSKKPNSVILVSFGSIATITNENLLEFAWGLANSNQFFLWVLRPDLVNGENSVIPNDFLSEIKERGLITSWCDQETVLKHPSLGGYLTHCGWNSTLDTICGGVPVLCWPFFAEQQTNCWFSCGKWGIGLEIDGNVDRTEVEKQVRELMESDQGKGMLSNAKKWKKLAEKSVENECGSSYMNFNKLVNDVLLPMKQFGK